MNLLKHKPNKIRMISPALEHVLHLLIVLSKHRLLPEAIHDLLSRGLAAPPGEGVVLGDAGVLYVC
jgi:hypothetical protein